MFAITLALCSGFSAEVARRGAVNAPRAAQVVAVAVAAADAEAAERLWTGSFANKPLLRIGKTGATATHANGLSDLCEHHAYVNVRLTGRDPDEALDQLVGHIGAATPDAKPSLTLLAKRVPRKGGVEALFSQSSRVDEVCSFEYHEANRAAAKHAEIEALADAETYKEERAAAVARTARQADKLGSKSGAPRQWRSARSQPPRSRKTSMMAKVTYTSKVDLQEAIRAYLKQLPEGAVDDPSLPSALNYKELAYNGRQDIVEGCMAHGGYLQLSNEMGVPVRIKVKHHPRSAWP